MPRPLSAELAALHASLSAESVQLRTLLATLQGRAYALLMIVLVLPFAAPVSVPGMSTPLVIVIGGTAVQLAAGRLPWLPRRLLDARLPAGFVGKVLVATKGVVRFLEKFVRRRLLALTDSRVLLRAHLFAIAAAAALLALPLPIPLTNTIPGWAILLIALGLLERDGLFILAGYVALIVAVLYFAALGESVRHSLHWLIDWWKS